MLHKFEGDESYKKAFLGIDGGGTKTEFVLFYENGKIIKHIILAGSNPNSCGMEQTLRVLDEGINSIKAENIPIYGIFAGIAGCGIKENSKVVYEFLSKLCPDSDVSCDSDVLNVIASASKSEKSIAVICGTGSSVYVYDGEGLHRVGGWGYLLGDACSGYTLGRAVLRASLAEEDGFGDKTKITELVHEKLNSYVIDKIGDIYSNDKRYIASFAPILFDAADCKDDVAISILNKETDELAELINFADKKYDCGEDVILAGSIFSKTCIIDDYLRDKIKRNIIVPQLPQIYGACVYCLSKYKNIGTEFNKNFTNTYQTHINKEKIDYAKN